MILVVCVQHTFHRPIGNSLHVGALAKKAMHYQTMLGDIDIFVVVLLLDRAAKRLLTDSIYTEYYGSIPRTNRASRNAGNKYFITIALRCNPRCSRCSRANFD